MPGWFIHMDVARKALGDLEGFSSAADIFSKDGPSPKELSDIARANPAYVALGAIGPDFFSLLPDFKGSIGNFIRWAAA